MAALNGSRFLPCGPAPLFGPTGEFMLFVFTQDGVPTWEVRRRVNLGSDGDDLLANGTAFTFEAAKAAALFDLGAQAPE
jgi:hypothetical protein